MDGTNIVEIPNFFDRRTAKKITFKTEGINIEKLLSFDPPVFIPVDNINAFRYGVTFTWGYKFVIGRQYFVELKDFNNKIYKFKLQSIYGIKRKTYHKKWSALINQLWSNYFSNQLSYYWDLYSIGQTFELVGVNFLFEGISWDREKRIEWKEIALSNYQTYFMIHHSENLNQRTSRNFSTDWNAFILQCLLKKIIQQQKKEK